MRGLQEKFQVVIPAKEEAGEQWVSARSQRDLRGMQPWCNSDSIEQDPRKFNLVPPGMEIHNQFYTQQQQMPLVMAGQSDVSKDTNPQSFDKGFTKREMKGSDDCYTGEHIDHFYGDAGGFVERNNYLDRI